MQNLSKINNNVNFVNGNIKDYKLLERLAKDSDGVFHQAALVSVPQSFKMQAEYFDVNTKGTENVLKLAKEYGFKVVYASSSSVYGNQKQTSIKESDNRNPTNPYAETKLKAELLAEKYSEMGVRVIGLRYFNVYGRRQSKEYAGVIKLFLERIQQNNAPKINGDGLQTRDFVYVEDVVKANILAMDSNVKHQFFNVGMGYSISILDLANMIIDASGLSLRPIHDSQLPGDIRDSQADLELINKLLKWKPVTKLEDWLIEVITSKKFKDI
jgi:UDP-glucose 4-epimerase